MREEKERGNKGMKSSTGGILFYDYRARNSDGEDRRERGKEDEGKK